MVILGIETSCDETALALIETRGSAGSTAESAGGCRVIASLVHSQAELHSVYGGVFPTLAKREHAKNLVPLLQKLLTEADGALAYRGNTNASLDDIDPAVREKNTDLFASFDKAEFLKHVPTIDRITVTEGPGLEPALWVGITFAEMLAHIWNIPLVAVNHMEGHVLGSLIDADAPFGSWQTLKPVAYPALALLISGGHTELVKIDKAADHDSTDHSGPGMRYTIIGETKDDAVGEAFDKVARLLGLPYPGGPHISKLSHEAFEAGIQSPVKLPRPMITSGDLNFSFSGLKTAVLYAVRNHSEANGALSDEFKKGLAREFEMAVAETLVAKLRAGIEKTGARTLIIGGGVSANHVLRRRFQEVAREYGIPLYLPSHHVSGDNALMIALAGAFHAPESRTLKASGTKRLGA